MVLIDKDVWNKKDFELFDGLFNCSKEIIIRLIKILFLVIFVIFVECSEMKFFGLVDEVVIKFFWMSVLICFL